METRIVARLVTARLCLTRVLIQNLHRMLYLLEESEATSSNKVSFIKCSGGSLIRRSSRTFSYI